MNFHGSDRVTPARNRRPRLIPALCSTIAVLFSFLASAPAAVVEPAPSHVPTLLSLRLVPEQVSLQGPGASQHFVVMGTFADGLERDLTSEQPVSSLRYRIGPCGRWRQSGGPGAGGGDSKGRERRTRGPFEDSNRRRRGAETFPI